MERLGFGSILNIGVGGADARVVVGLAPILLLVERDIDDIIEDDVVVVPPTPLVESVRVEDDLVDAFDCSSLSELEQLDC